MKIYHNSKILEVFQTQQKQAPPPAATYYDELCIKLPPNLYLANHGLSVLIGRRAVFFYLVKMAQKLLPLSTLLRNCPLKHLNLLQQLHA